jgi:aspartyl-tRNA synthetase
VDSDKGSNEGMIFFRVELLRLRDLVRAVGLSLLRLEGLSEEKIENIKIEIRIKNLQQFNRSNQIPES